jgi:hypothetical protein
VFTFVRRELDPSTMALGNLVMAMVYEQRAETVTKRRLNEAPLVLIATEIMCDDDRMIACAMKLNIVALGDRFFPCRIIFFPCLGMTEIEIQPRLPKRS